jgi:serine/threonine protein kinase
MCENALTEYRFDNYILKEIKLEPGKDKEFSKQFKIHSNMKYLNDERIVQYFSVWLKDDVDPHDKRLESSTLYVQMELCEKALRDIINEIENDSNLITFEKKTKRLTSLGYYIASQLFIETLEGVDYLHKQIPPIIHRGLKPENIMLKIGSNNRFVKIGDLGLVAVHEYADQSHTSLGHSDNTNAKYTAPEVLNSRNYNTKADIYSLGVILQELFKIDINGYKEYALILSKFLIIF